MILREFPEQTVVIAENQPEYLPLPAYRYQFDPQGTIVCCWKLTWRERLAILFGAPLWHRVLTFNKRLMPLMLSVEKPDMPPHLELTPAEVTTLRDIANGVSHHDAQLQSLTARDSLVKKGLAYHYPEIGVSGITERGVEIASFLNLYAEGK